MAYRSEYHRDVQRDTDDHPSKQGGWKSWFGFGDNKDRDEDRGYQSTTTYRINQPQYGGYGERDRYTTERGGYSGPYSGTRGGYGYTSSDEVARPSWTTDRDYQTRTGYGQYSGDRDYRETRTYGGDRDRDWSKETRTYGGDRDRDWTTTRGPTTTDYHPSSWTPSRTYGGYGGDYTRDYTSGTRDYPTTSRYPVTGDNYPSYGPSRGYGFERDTYSTSRNYPETTSRSWGYGDSRRDTTGYTSGYTGGYGGGYGSGYAGDSYIRSSYQPTSYRY